MKNPLKVGFFSFKDGYIKRNPYICIMKKLITILLVAVLFSMSCEEEVKTSQLHPASISVRQEPKTEGEIANTGGPTTYSNSVSFYKREIEGMEFGIFVVSNGGTHTVNLTKEKLEIKLLKNQINDYK